MIIYNLFPSLAGNLRDWKPHLVRAAEMGLDWIFLNPIQFPGHSESLYSIKDYFRLNPLLVDGASSTESVAGFKRMAGEAQALDLKLMVDLVVSHCAFDSALLTEHPGWFRRENGRIAHPFCVENQKKVVWKDLAQFDHKHAQDKEGLFQYLFRVVQFLADLGIKGFRCDAAYQVPASFWRRLINETRHKYPGTVFLAETLGCSPAETAQTAKAGFDYIFNSAKWWDFYSPWLLEQYNLTREETQSISFPESHDTPRLAESLQGNVDGLKQRYLFSALFSAGVMMPIGFEFGFRKKLHVAKTRPQDWEQPETDLSGFIQRVNQAKSLNPIFREDAATEMLPADNPNILLLWKGSLRARQEALLILNKDIHNKERFYTDNLYHYVQNQSPLTDVSPEFPLEYLPTPFEYNLRPGQGIILVTHRAGQ